MLGTPKHTATGTALTWHGPNVASTNGQTHGYEDDISDSASFRGSLVKPTLPAKVLLLWQMHICAQTLSPRVFAPLVQTGRHCRHAAMGQTDETCSWRTSISVETKGPCTLQTSGTSQSKWPNGCSGHRKPTRKNGSAAQLTRDDLQVLILRLLL